MTAPLRQSEPNVVKVALDARGYDILIGRGLLADLGQRVKALRPGSRAAIVTDETVGKIHLSAAEAALKQCGVDSTHIIVPAGENSKNYATFEKVCEAIIAARLERNDLVVALGGGVVGDLAGFAASCVRRGTRFCTSADDAACAGRFLGRWQDRNQFASGKKSDRCVSSTDHGDRRHSIARHIVETGISRRLCRGCQIRVAWRRCVLCLA